MKLITKEIEERLPKLYSQELEVNPIIIVKYFHPLSNWTWYAIEGERQSDGDLMFFGMVDGNEKELGYFNLRQLEEVKVGGLGIERDMYFGYNHRLNEFRGLEITIKIQEREWGKLLEVAQYLRKKVGKDTEERQDIIREEIGKAIENYTMENLP